MHLTQSKKNQPTTVASSEREIFMLTIMYYVNDTYTGNIQMEFDTEIKMRDYVQSKYELEDHWTRTIGENEFWTTDSNGDIVTHVLLLQKIKKVEKITKVLLEDNLMF